MKFPKVFQTLVFLASVRGETGRRMMDAWVLHVEKFRLSPSYDGDCHRLNPSSDGASFLVDNQCLRSA